MKRFASRFQPKLLAHCETTTSDGYDAWCRLGTPRHTPYHSSLQYMLLMDRRIQHQFMGMSVVSALSHPDFSGKFPFHEYPPPSVTGTGTYIFRVSVPKLYFTPHVSKYTHRQY
uniref:Uncharacterized protein n=1 Tax=Rhipicephalus zambeziensis TaxID=60191 RepID=A0A224YE33_9ACAR